MFSSLCGFTLYGSTQSATQSLGVPVQVSLVRVNVSKANETSLVTYLLLYVPTYVYGAYDVYVVNINTGMYQEGKITKVEIVS